jgi:predicted nuclease of predicted toxin-antitoxin system
MNILLDENVDIRLKAALVALGHDVTAIVTDYSHSLTDEQVLAIAVSEERLLVTNDRDFGELIVRSQAKHRGVIYLRLTTVDFASLLARVTFVLTTQHEILNELLIVSDQRIRRRQGNETETNER